jgi:hypothetical protein
MAFATAFRGDEISEGRLMTRNWFALASRTVRLLESRTEGPRRRCAGIMLESLEVRLPLSALPTAPVPADLNPQPLPPGIVAAPIKATPSSDDWNAPMTIRLISGGTVTPGNGQHVGNSVAIRQTDKTSPVLWQNVAPFIARSHTPPKTFSPDPGPGCDLGGCIHVAALAYSGATS